MKIKNLLSALAIATVVFAFGCKKDEVPGLYPEVISSDPIDNATNIVLNKTVTITFSETMNPATITSTSITIKNGSTLVEGTVSYSGTSATFVPKVAFTKNTLFTGTVTTAVENESGMALENAYEWEFTTGSSIAARAVVQLGSAGNYVILAKSAITNITESDITGDLGLSPAATSYITGLDLVDATGYAESWQITGKVYAADMADPTPINLTTAVNNMITAYTDAAGRSIPDYLELGTGNIGGKTLSPGLYKWTSTVTLPSSVTISGGADDVWIFQISGDLSVANAVRLNLIGDAQAKNIFWQVAGEATFGTTSHFEGIILSQTGITFQTGATFKGRALAQTAVVLDANVVVLP